MAEYAIARIGKTVCALTPRHTCASLLVAQGVPMKQILLWLGHSTFSTTADIYSHLSTAAMDEPAICIASLLTGPEKEVATDLP